MTTIPPVDRTAIELDGKGPFAGDHREINSTTGMQKRSGIERFENDLRLWQLIGPQNLQSEDALKPPGPQRGFSDLRSESGAIGDKTALSSTVFSRLVRRLFSSIHLRSIGLRASFQAGLPRLPQSAPQASRIAPPSLHPLSSPVSDFDAVTVANRVAAENVASGKEQAP